MKKYYVDKQSVYILKVITAILQICIIITIKYLLYYFKQVYPDSFLFKDEAASELTFLITVVVLIIAYVIFSFIILPIWYRSVCYIISADEIIIKSGVLFKTKCYVKISSVQYTETVRCPFFGKSNINFLLINAYGGRLVLMLLSSSDLEEINKKIQTFLSDRGGL